MNQYAVLVGVDVLDDDGEVGEQAPREGEDYSVDLGGVGLILLLVLGYGGGTGVGEG